METFETPFWLAGCAFILLLTAAMHAMPERIKATGKHGKTCTGVIVSADPKGHVLTVKCWGFWKRVFDIGEHCTCVLLEKSPAGIDDLHSGQKVVVAFQDVGGVPMAESVTQVPMRYEGLVKEVDLSKCRLILHRKGLFKMLQIANDCQIVADDDTARTFADFKTGDYVTVTYETPDDVPTVRRIEQQHAQLKPASGDCGSIPGHLA